MHVNILVPRPHAPRSSTAHKQRAALVVGYGVACALVGSYLLDAARDMATVERQRTDALTAADRMLVRLDTLREAADETLR